MKYKIEEAIHMLRENPELDFKNVNGTGEDLYVDSNHGLNCRDIDMNAEYELFKYEMEEE